MKKPLCAAVAGPTEGAKPPTSDNTTADEAAAGIQPFPGLTKAAVEALRYRGEDIARSITKAVVKEARAKELRLELLNSKRLKAFFEEHPGERQRLLTILDNPSLSCW